MKSVAFYTLGCKLNFSETGAIAKLMTEQGYEVVDFHQTPDVYVINTCSVTDHADRKCKKVVKEAKRISPHSFVTIVGCYAQLKPEEIAGIEGVDAVLGASEKFKLMELLNGFEHKAQPRIHVSPITDAVEYHSSYTLDDRTRTFLKVQDGCDYTCAFCTIPMARGASRSAWVADVVKQAHEIADRGVKEIVLTGVNIGDFGLHGENREESFLDLITALDHVEGISRFRISSIEPNLLTDEIIRFVAASERFVPHFHIPLQSGSNKILGLMRRRYKRELYAERVATIKNLMPDCCIGVDVITGFPGETEADFMETFDFIHALEVSYLHVFTYSERANTHALKLKGRVPERIRNERTTQLRNLSEKKKRYFYEQQIGKTARVLWEAEEDKGLMHGFTDNYVKVSMPYDPLSVNELKTVKLTGMNDSNGEMQVYEIVELPQKLLEIPENQQ